MDRAEAGDGRTVGRRAAFAFIFTTALIDILAAGIIIPVLPNLVKQFMGGDFATAARWTGIFGFAFAAAQLISTPIMGSLSDRFGRRPVILVSIIGLGLDYILMAVAPSVVWLLVGRVIAGATSATFAAVNAYVADISPPEKRSELFGWIATAISLGFVLGPALGGALGAISPRAPFWASAALALCNGLFGLFILPESLPAKHRTPFSFRTANLFGSFGLYRSMPGLAGLAGVIFLFYLANQVFRATFVLYLGYRYGWNTATVGFYLGISGIAAIVARILCVKPVVSRVGDQGALLVGLALGLVGFVIFAAARTGAAFWLALPFFALIGLAMPGAQGLMSRRVSATQQGRLQGANANLMALAGLIGPILFTRVFAWSITGARRTVPDLAGATAWLSAIAIALSLIIALRLKSAPAEIAHAGSVKAGGAFSEIAPPDAKGG